MTYDLTGHTRKTVKERVNIAVEQLEQSETPRLYYPIKGSQESRDAIRDHYFSRYFREGSTYINLGATFSTKDLTSKPDGWDNTWGILYIASKTDSGFVIHIVEPHTGQTDYNLMTLTFDMSAQTYEYSKNLTTRATSYASIQAMFSNVGQTLGLVNIFFSLSPRTHPMFYYDMYKSMATLGNETANYVGRFFERLVEYNKLELLYKSGLPKNIVDKYIVAVVDSHVEAPIDLTQTSARMMLKLSKPLWKLALKDMMTYGQLWAYYSETVRHEERLNDVYSNLANNLGFSSYYDWLEDKLPPLQAYDYYAIPKEHRATLDYCKKSDLIDYLEDRYENLRYRQLRNLSPEIDAYYRNRYEKELQKHRKHKQRQADTRDKEYQQEHANFLRTIDIVKSLNEEYGVNHTKAVVTGEGGALLGKSKDTSAIGMYKNYGLDLKNLVRYIYYVLPLDQGFTLRGSLRPRGAFEDIGNSTYRDYIDMASRLSEGYTRYPKHLKTNHDIIEANLSLVEDAIFAQKLEAETAKAIEYENVKVSCSKYKVVVPRTIEEFIREGNDMGNCVKSYAHSVVAGRKQIIFVREASLPEKSLIDVEIRGNQIVQALQKYNAPLNAEQREFINEFADNAGLVVKTWDREGGHTSD